MIEFGRISGVVWRILRLCLFTIVVGLVFTIYGMSQLGGGFIFFYINSLVRIGIPVIGILTILLITLLFLKKRFDNYV